MEILTTSISAIIKDIPFVRKIPFLQKVLKRPANERAFLLIPVGYPAEYAKVPDICRKPLDQVAVFYESISA